MSPQSKESKNYFIVEFRFPYEIKNEKDANDAVEVARTHFNDQYGFFPDKWNARVFEFSGGEGTIGPQKEYFFSPTGTTIKDIAKNIPIHEQRIKDDNNGDDEGSNDPSNG